MDSSIGARVAAALPPDRTQREVAALVGMSADAFSRALNGKRGFSAIELARLGELSGRDVHYLITGEADPNTLRVAARHTYDSATGKRENAGAAGDEAVLGDIALAYRQVSTLAALTASSVPRGPEACRKALGGGFVRPFVVRLEAMGIDVVRVSNLKTAYSFFVGGRPIIALPSTGNWFYENWSLAHELGHLSLGHHDAPLGSREHDRDEAAANHFAASLLLPKSLMTQIDWEQLTPADLAKVVWDFGVSTSALSTRIGALGLQASEDTRSLLAHTTQWLLRHHWASPEGEQDPIASRMDEAATRHFPVELQDAHLALIVTGALHKGTLAWMLDVEAANLEVEEPTEEAMSGGELAALLG